MQALKALGENHIDAAALDTLRQKLTDKERRRAIREAGYATAQAMHVHEASRISLAGVINVVLGDPVFICQVSRRLPPIPHAKIALTPRDF